MRGWVAHARWEKCESVEAPRKSEDGHEISKIERQNMHTEENSVDRLELGKGVVERKNLRRADEGEVTVAQRAV